MSRMESAFAALNALEDDDPDTFLRVMRPDLSGRLAQPLFDVSESRDIRCRLPRSHRKWGFVTLQFGYAIHLAILLQAVRVLHALLDASAEHVAQLENDGSTVLHTLAKCQMYAPRFKHSKRLEKLLLHALMREPRLLERLLTQEDSDGLRPLEACVKFAAFRLARKLLHLPNYLIRSETRFGGWVVRLYDLTDYDLCHGSRCHVSPMHLLTYVSSSQVDSLKKSKLLEDPLIRQWLRLISRQTRVITGVRLLLMGFPTVVFLLSVVSKDVMLLVSCFGILLHCNRATFNASASLGFNETDLLNSTIYYWQFSLQTVKQFNCENVFQDLDTCNYMIIVLAAFLGLTSAVKLVFSIWERRQKRKLLTAETWSSSELFVRRTIFDGYHMIALLSGICFALVVNGLQGETFYRNLLPMNKASGRIIEQMLIGSNTLFIAFTLLHFAQYMEIATKSIGKLFFCFHCMMSSFLAALPLLFYWTALFSLIFYILLNTADFNTGMLSLYASVKVILNMITFDLDSPMVLIFHVLFFVFVGLNLLNFLIAFVTEVFLKGNAEFEVAFDLLRLLAALKTFRYFRIMIRCSHWFEVRSQGSCKRRVAVEVMQPKFKKTKTGFKLSIKEVATLEMRALALCDLNIEMARFIRSA